MEIIADCPDVETVFVPVGGGGLIGGVGSALKALNPSVKVIAVEPAGCPSLHQSLESGKPATVECNTICDGVAVPYITDEMFPLLQQIVDEVRLVSDEAVKSAVKRLALGNKIVAEPSGALATAAALDMSPTERGTADSLVTGGSVDAAKFVSILEESVVAQLVE